MNGAVASTTEAIIRTLSEVEQEESTTAIVSERNLQREQQQQQQQQQQEHDSPGHHSPPQQQQQAMRQVAANAYFCCNICLDAVQDPVVTQCGHLYCWPCLYQWLEPGMLPWERRALMHHDAGGWTAAGSGPTAPPTATSTVADLGRRVCPVCKAPCSVPTLVPIYAVVDGGGGGASNGSPRIKASLNHGGSSTNAPMAGQQQQQQQDAIDVDQFALNDDDDDDVDAVLQIPDEANQVQLQQQQEQQADTNELSRTGLRRRHVVVLDPSSSNRSDDNNNMEREPSDRREPDQNAATTTTSSIPARPLAHAPMVASPGGTGVVVPRAQEGVMVVAAAPSSPSSTSFNTTMTGGSHMHYSMSLGQVFARSLQEAVMMSQQQHNHQQQQQHHATTTAPATTTASNVPPIHVRHDASTAWMGTTTDPLASSSSFATTTAAGTPRDAEATEFLSRILLLLGSFVIFCLLIF